MEEHDADRGHAAQAIEQDQPPRVPPHVSFRPFHSFRLERTR
jgi:hypothetical protein